MRRIAAVFFEGLDPSLAESSLRSAAETAWAFGPTVSYCVGTSVVWVDVTGCAHLHGGEGPLAAALVASMRALLGAHSRSIRVSVASGPNLARMFATHRAETQIRVVRVEVERRALGRLPIDLLPLDEKRVEWLRGLAVRTLDDLRRLPRSSLALRLSKDAGRIFSLLDGDDRVPLTPYTLPALVEERFDFDEPIESVQGLFFVLHRLMHTLASRVKARAEAVSQLVLDLHLDALRARTLKTTSVVVDLPKPLDDAADLLAVLRIRLDRVDLTSPVLGLTLRASERVRASRTNEALFAPRARAERTLPRLVAELATDLGPSNLGTLCLLDQWVPERRSRLLPFGEKPPKRRPHVALFDEVPEPARLLHTPVAWKEPLTSEKRLLLREYASWWTAAPEARAACTAAWSDSLRSSLWVERSPAFATPRVRGFVLG